MINIKTLTKEKLLQGALYSLDKLIVECAMRKCDAQSFMDRFSFKTNVTQWVSNKLSVCRYNYSFDLDDNKSFWVGFQPNWKKSQNDVSFARIEFNPSKVCDSLEFISVFNSLKVASSLRFEPLRFDLAIDFPVARDKVHLVKDKRLYEEYSYSTSNRTQYLGVRNNHGRIKIYNKALEQKLDIDLTRLEVTLDYENCNVEEVNRLIPCMYLLDSFQFDLDMNGTDKVIMVAILSDFSLLNDLSRRKRAKILEYLNPCVLNYKIDVVKYNNILNEIMQYVK